MGVQLSLYVRNVHRAGLTLDGVSCGEEIMGAAATEVENHPPRDALEARAPERGLAPWSP